MPPKPGTPLASAGGLARSVPACAGQGTKRAGPGAVAGRADRWYPPGMSDDLTIQAFQQHIREKYYAADKARGTPGTFMWLVEEVGELATALHKSAGDGTATSGHDDPASEFADVLAWLCTLANINEIDLAEAVRAKYLEGEAPSGHK